MVLDRFGIIVGSLFVLVGLLACARNPAVVVLDVGAGVFPLTHPGDKDQIGSVHFRTSLKEVGVQAVPFSIEEEEDTWHISLSETDGAFIVWMPLTWREALAYHGSYTDRRGILLSPGGSLEAYTKGSGLTILRSTRRPNWDGVVELILSEELVRVVGIFSEEMAMDPANLRRLDQSIEFHQLNLADTAESQEAIEFLRTRMNKGGVELIILAASEANRDLYEMVANNDIALFMEYPFPGSEELANTKGFFLFPWGSGVARLAESPPDIWPEVVDLEPSLYWRDTPGGVMVEVAATGQAE